MKRNIFTSLFFLFISHFLMSQSILNGTFESWVINDRYDFPSNWLIIEEGAYTSQHIEKSNDAQLGSFSIKLNTVYNVEKNENNVGILIYGDPGDGDFKGWPYSELGDMFHVWYKSNIVGDAGLLILNLFKNGVKLEDVTVPITGINNTWTQLSFPVNPTQQQPDSMFIAFLSGTPTFFGGNPVAGSWLMIDNIYFTLGANPTPIPVPNFSFENWETLQTEDPEYWETENGHYYLYANDTNMVCKTTDVHSGTYALNMRTVGVNNECIEARMRYLQPINYAPEEISFYYKYFPAGIDTIRILVDFNKNGMQVGGYYYEFTNEAQSYTLASGNLFYNEIPDEVLIRINGGQNCGTTLILDDFKFSCPKPKNLFGEFVNPTSAQLSWAQGGFETEWELEWGLKGFLPSAGTTVQINNTPGYLLNGISNSNSYDFYVRSVCATNDQSSWVGPFNFCNSVNVPINETFEFINNGAIPDCWNRYIVDQGRIEVADMGNAHNGTKYLNISFNNFNPSILTTPQMQQNLSALFVAFFAKKANWVSDVLLELGTMSNPSDPTTFNLLQSYQLTNSYESYDFYLNNYLGTDKYLAFKITSTQWGGEAFIDDILINYLPTCIPPKNLQATNITASEATITWQAGSSETLWNIVWGQEGFNPNTQGTPVNGLNTNSFDLNLLSSGTIYDFYVKADCGSGTLSTWNKITFSTLCDVFSAPFSQNFESTNEFQIPVCWDKKSTNGSSVEVVSWWQSTSGMNSARMVWFNNSSTAMLITPQISNALNQLYVSFKAKKASQDQPIITIGTMADPTDELTFSPLTTFNPTSNFEEYLCFFNNYSGSDHYIAIKLSSLQETYNEVYIDDISIQFLPSCIPPNSLNVQGITTNSALFSWQAGNNETLWNLKYDFAGFDPNTQGNEINGLLVPQYNLNGILNSGTNYDVYVQADCQSGNISQWIKKSFTTLCSAFNVPITVDFETTTPPNIPNCWSKIITNWAQTEVVGWFQSTSGMNSLKMQLNNPDSAIFISPQLIPDINALYISLKAKKQNWSNNAVLVVGTMSTPSNFASFSPLTQFNLNDNFNYYEYTFDSYSGSDDYIAIRLITSDNGTEVFIDDIILDSIPTCIKPINLMAQNITVNSANLSWQAGGSETLWDVEIGPPGFSPGTFSYMYINEGISNPLWNINTLSPASTFDFWVRADCGGGDLSNWTGPYSFTTLCPVFSLPFVEDFSFAPIQQVPNCWNRTANNWHVYNSNNAGSSIPELNFIPNPQVFGKQRVETPFINAIYANNLMLSFKHSLYHNPSGNPYSVGVEVSTNGVNWTSVWMLNPTAGIFYQDVSIDLTSFVGSDIKLSWVFDGNSNDIGSWFIDDVLLEELSGCPQPTNLLVNNLTQTSVELNWDAGGIETVWNVEVGYPWFTPGTNTALQYDNNTNNNFSNISGLTMGTSYEFWVQANCGSGLLSSWSGPYSFTTVCGTYNLPYSQNFNGIPQGEIPNCFNRSTNNWFVNQNNSAGGFMPELIFYWDPNVIGKNTVSSPLINATTASSLMLTFKHRLFHKTADPYTIGVEVSTDDILWTEVWSTIPTGDILANELNIDISAYVGNNVRIRWFFDGESWDTDRWVIDDIFVDVIPTCPKPVNLSAINITPDEADLIWDAGGAETEWNIEIGAPGFIPGTWSFIYQIGPTSVNPFNIGGFSPSTFYEFYVQADCGAGDLSTWAGPFSFKTLCPVYSIPFTENFSTTAENEIPECWNRNSNNWYVQNTNNAGAIMPELIFNFFPQTNGYQSITTPTINATSVASLQLSFRHKLTHHNASPYNIGVDITTDNIAWTNIWSAFPTSDIQAQEVVIDLSAYIGNNIKIAWYFNGNSFDTERWFIDNIVLDLLPTCPQPKALNVTNIAQNSASLGWTAGGTETKWNVEIGYPGFAYGSGSEIQSFTATTSNPLPVSNLQAGTFYEFYVQADCDGGDFSNVVGPFQFATLCGALTNPFYENFDATANNVMPYCWFRNVVHSTGAFVGVYDLEPLSHPKHLILWNGNAPDANAKLIAITPEIQSINQFQISFMAKTNIAGTPLIVGTMSNKNNPATFQAIQTLNLTANYTEYMVSFTSYVGSNNFIAFAHGNPGAGNQNAIFIDNFSLEPPETCPKPTQIISENISSNSTLIEWVESGQATSWQIQWGNQSFTLGTGQIADANTTSYFIDNLMAEAAYDVYVRAICGPADTSKWSGPYTFNTELMCTPNAIYGQTPTPILNFLWATDAMNYKLFQNFISQPSYFDAIHLWGAMAYNDGMNYPECYHAPIDIEVGIYLDNNGVVGAQIASYIIPVTPDSTYATLGGFQIYEFNIQLPQVFFIANGWFSVRSTNSPSCYTLFANTTNPAAQGTSIRVNNNDSLTYEPLAFCLLNNAHNVSYTAGANGSISGISNQYVIHGNASNAVTAVPDPCYEFVKWSDDLTDNPRIDNPVTEDIAVTAIFTLRNIVNYLTEGICQDDTLFFENQILTTPGNYTGYFVTGDGCDSTVHLTLFVYPTFEFVYYENFCAGNALNWRGNDYDVAGTYYDSLQTVFGCDSIFVLYLSEKPNYYYSYYQEICNGEVFNWRGNDYTTNGMHYDNYISQYGCDSIFALQLVVNDTYFFETYDTICNGNAYNWHNNIYTNSGIYYDSLTSQYGCDSIFKLYLTVSDVFEFVAYDTICNGDVYPWHNNTYTTSGTYYDNLLTQYGCDSIYILHLTVHDSYEFVTNENICDGNTYLWRNNTYDVTGTYYDSLLTQHGCDSVFVLHLTVNDTYEFVTYDTICDGESYVWQNNIYTEAKVYYDSLTTQFGCDSIYILHLMVNPTYTFVQYDTICENDIYTWRGNDYILPGIYYDSLLTDLGCDSIYVLHLDVVVLNLLVTQNGAALTSEAINVLYQWVDCDNNFAHLTGETDAVFNAIANGNYAVIITGNFGCADTSACFNVTGVNVHAEDKLFSINLYPNPNDGNFNISLFEETFITLWDALGHKVFEKRFTEGLHSMNFNHLPNGVYFIRAQNRSAVDSIRVVIQK